MNELREAAPCKFMHPHRQLSRELQQFFDYGNISGLRFIWRIFLNWTYSKLWARQFTKNIFISIGPHEMRTPSKLSGNFSGLEVLRYCNVTYFLQGTERIGY